MSNTSSTHTIKVTDDGSLKKTTQSAEQLKKTLDAAGQSAEKVAGTAPRTNKSVNAAKQAMSREQGISGNEVRNYGVSRASGSGTGASARDFAKQAEGLGGLVRLYATFAANIFAATAAFGALSKAMDTTNMVKGLDQLGAATGRNLGSLAKRVMEITDNAVSMREAMDAVAKASSAGLSDQQIVKLGAAANKASIALGLNMTDALSRLSRGISKIEPELLDELGIFVRVDDAVNKYALSVGKSAASLSDFERRQAFANAVLDQAQKKFGDINIDANPYTKLAASLQNVAQTGLELINKVLGPIAKLLSESPLALGAGIAYIATMLAKQAIPALGQWKQGLRDAAEQAAKTAKAFSDDYGDNFVKKTENIFKLPELEKELAEANKRLEKLGGEAASALPNITNEKFKFLKIKDDDPARLEAAKSTLKDQVAQLNKLEKAEGSLNEAQKKRAETIRVNIKEIELHNRVLAENIERNNLLAQRTDIQSKIRVAKDEIEVEANRPRILGKRYDPEQLALDKKIEAQRKYAQLSAISTASETARIGGVRLAWLELNKTIEKEGITGLQKYTTLAKGGMAAIGSRIMGVVGALGNVGMVIGVLVGAGAALNAMFSKNEKESTAFDASLGHVEDSVKAVGNALDFISKKPFLEQLSPASMQAKAAAITNLSENLNKLVADLGKVEAAAGGWDRFVDGWLRPFGKDLRTKMARQIVAATEAAAKNAESAAEAANIKERVAKALGVTDLNVDIIANIDTARFEDSMKAGAAVITDVGKKATDATLPMRRLQESIEAGSTSMKEMTKSLTAGDPISKLGTDMVKVGNDLSEAFKNPADAIQAMQALLKDTASLSLLPASRREELLSYRKELEGIISSTAAYKSALKGLEEGLARVKAEHEAQSEVETSVGEVADKDGTRMAQIGAMEKMVKQLQGSIADQFNKQKKFVEIFTGAGKEIFSKGTALLEKSVSIAFAKANLGVDRAKFARATGEAKIIIESDLQKKEVELQLMSIDIQASLVAVMAQTNLISQRQYELDYQEAQKRDKPEGFEANIAESNKRWQSLELAINKLANPASLSGADFRNPIYGQHLQQVQAPLMGVRAQKASLSGKLQEININTQNALEDAEFEKAQKLRTMDIDRVKLAKERQDILAGLYLIETQSNLAIRQGLEAEIAKQEAEKQRQELLRNSFNAQKVQADLLLMYEASVAEMKKNNTNATRTDVAERARAVEAAGREVAIIQESISALDERTSAARQFKTVLDAIRTAELDATTRDRWLSQIYAIEDQYKQIKSVVLDIEDAQISAAERTGAYSQKYIANQRRALAVSRQLANAEADIAEMKRKQLDERKPIQLKIDTSKKVMEKTRPGGEAPNEKDYAAANKALGEANEAMQVMQGYQETQISNLERINELRLKALEIAEQQNIEQAKFNDLTKDMQTFADSLTGAFGKIGEAIGQVATNSMNWAKQDTEYSKQKVKLNEEIYNAYSERDVATAKEKEIELKKVETKQDVATLQNLGAQANAVKKLFKEKTFAFKALDALEKASHIAAMARMAEGMATSLAAMFTDTGAGVAKLFAQGGWAGFVGAAAFIALMASYGMKGGGKAGASPAQKREVFGTGQTYDKNGELKDNGGGILGDPTAKSDTIEKNIELMSKNSFEGLGYSNKILDTLKEIRDINAKVAKGIYQEGLASSVTNETKVRNWADPLAGASDSEITDRGVILAGLLGELAKGVDGVNTVMRAFERTTTTDYFLPGGHMETDKYDTDQYRDLKGSPLGDYFADYFTANLDLIDEVGKKLGVASARSIAAGMEAPEILKEISTMGLKGQELIDALNSATGIWMDQVWQELFPSMERFTKIGESYADTVMRVINTNEQIGQGLKLMGANFVSVFGDVASNLRTYEVVDNPGEKVVEPIKRWVDTYIEQGESYERVIEGHWEDTGETITKIIGRTTKTVTETIQEAGFRISEALVKDLGGSLEKASEIMNTYISNFVPKQEQLNVFRTQMEVDKFSIIKNQVSKYTNDKLSPDQLTAKKESLGVQIAGLDTREEFNSLITQLMTQDGGLANDSNRQLMSTLLKDIMPNLLLLTDAIKSLTDVELAKAKRDQKIEISKLEGNYQQAVELERTKTLENLPDPRLREDQERIWALQDSIRLRNIETDILKAQGRDYEVLIRNREDELKGLTDNEKARKLEQYRIEDSVKVRNEFISLLKAEGYSYQALQLEREKELLGLSEAEKMIRRQIHAVEDAARVRQEEISLLEAQGYSYAALQAKRADEIKGLSDTEKAIRRKRFAEEDANKTQDLNNQIMELTGEASKALYNNRVRELKAMSESDQKLQLRIWALQDEAKALGMQQGLLEDMGYTYQATQIARDLELSTMNAAEQYLTKLRHAQQDRNKTQAIELELMELEGRSAEAVSIARQNELKGLSKTDQALKIRLWRLQDEKRLTDARNNQLARMYQLLGNDKMYKDITRAMSLADMDPQLKPMEEYLHALEDQMEIKEKLKEAYESETQAAKSTIQALKDSSKALKDFKLQLLTGDKSPLKPADKYALAKSEVTRLLAIARGPTDTDAQREAVANAKSSITGAMDSFLEASRTLYASSGTYTSDFNWVTSILDSLIDSTDDQISTAEKQLNALEKNSTILEIIKENTYNTTDLLDQYLAAESKAKSLSGAVNTPITVKVEQEQDNEYDLSKLAPDLANLLAALLPPVQTAPTAPTTVDSRKLATMTDTTITGTMGYTATREQAKRDVTALIETNQIPRLFATAVMNGISSSMLDSLMGWTEGFADRWAVNNGLMSFKDPTTLSISDVSGVASLMSQSTSSAKSAANDATFAAIQTDTGLSKVANQTTADNTGKTADNTTNVSTNVEIQTTEIKKLNETVTKLLDELWLVKKELQALRSDHERHTGNLIGNDNLNTQDTIEAINNVSANGAEARVWNERTAFKIA